jgi:hypothetical protein
MKTIFTVLSALLLHVSISKAQTTLPYFTGFDNITQKAGWQEFRKGNTDPINKWAYTTTPAYSTPSSLGHHYPTGGTVTTDDWFVSPGFLIPAGGKVDSLRSYFSGFGVPDPSDTVAVYLLKGSPDPALATSKTLLIDYRGANYTNNSTWTSHTFTLAPATGTCYLAIKYKTIVNWLDVYFDNIRISANTTTSIHSEELQKEGIAVYPNPASESLQIRFEKQEAVPVSIKIYSVLGELQVEQTVKEQEALHVDLKNGTYFYTIVADDGAQLKSGKLIVQHL